MGPRLHPQEVLHCGFKFPRHGAPSDGLALTYSTEYLDDLATAIGRAVIEWNRLEYGTLGLGTRLAGCINAGTVGDPHQVIYIAFVNMDLRSRVSTVLAYASICDISNNYFSRVEKLMNKIINELQIERNRFLHDFWDMDPGGPPSRVHFSSRVTRPQSHTLELKVLRVTEYTSIADVNEFSNRLKLAYLELSALEGEASLSPQYQAASKMLRTTTDGGSKA